MTGNTWIWIVRGIASIAFGVLTLVLPVASIAALVLSFGIYAVVDGVAMFGYAFREKTGRGWFVVRGLLGIAAGIATFMWPGITAFSLYVMIGAWATAAGVMELAAAITLRDTLPRVGGLVFTGLLSLTLGIVMFVRPVTGLAAVVGIIAAYAIIHGTTLIGIGVRVHELFKPSPTRAGA